MAERTERQWQRANTPWRRRVRRITKRFTRRGRRARDLERKIREMEADDGR